MMYLEIYCIYIIDSPMITFPVHIQDTHKNMNTIHRYINRYTYTFIHTYIHHDSTLYVWCVARPHFRREKEARRTEHQATGRKHCCGRCSIPYPFFYSHIYKLYIYVCMYVCSLKGRPLSYTRNTCKSRIF